MTAMRGTRTRRITIAATTPMMAEGLKPSFDGALVAPAAGGAWGVDVDFEATRAIIVISRSLYVVAGAMMLFVGVVDLELIGDFGAPARSKEGLQSYRKFRRKGNDCWCFNKSAKVCESESNKIVMLMECIE
jgi:uncharacterized membrane protein